MSSENKYNQVFLDVDYLEDFGDDDVQNFELYSEIDEEYSQELEEPSEEPQGKKRKRAAKKKSKRDQEIDIKLSICEEIKKYACVYQITNKDYSNKNAKDAAWHQISSNVSARMGRSVKVHECRKYWDALKESTRIYLDKEKVRKISEKSGAPADMLDMYTEDGSQRFDIYQERWPLSDAMSFFLPSCARTAYTVSIGNRSAATALKRHGDEEECLEESFIVPATPSTSRKRIRSNELLDETLSSVATSLSNLVNARTNEDPIELKFKEFHVELDKTLRKMPFLQGMQFCIDMIKQANEVLECSEN
ncbi:uncharacterized protein LOC134213536 [Armigeres subalbatus]|uniref:uncharacterized protein LOC134213536 n=1 Tax=Armigeres subalbatus TaxID=124917 RepID=UPI002ECFC319